MPAPADGLALRELLAILQRRRRVIIWVTAMVTTVAVLMGPQVTRTYTATAQVMIEPRESRIIEAETSRLACQPRTTRSSTRTSGSSSRMRA